MVALMYGEPTRLRRMSRSPVALAALLTIALGLGVRLLWDGPVSKYAGDALYTVLIYLLVVLVWPRVRPWAAALTAAALLRPLPPVSAAGCGSGGRTSSS